MDHFLVVLIESAEASSRQALQPAGVRLSWINAKADLNWEGPDLVLRAALSRAAELPIEVVLSGVLTHEIGHVLLRSPAHALTGVMKGEWQVRVIWKN